MALQPSGTIERAQVILRDKTGRYFKESDLWLWLCDGQREVALQVPEAAAVTENLALVDGVTQSIPDTSHCLIDIPRNTTGETIRLIMKDIMDDLRPDWAKDTGSTTVQHYMYERDAAGRPKRPRNFEVWPPVLNVTTPATVTATVVCISSAMPDDSSYETDEFLVDVTYANALLDYTLYRGLSEFTGNPEHMRRATAHLEAFMIACGKDADNKLQLAPK